MQPSPVLGPSQAPRLFEDTSTYGNQPPVSTPYASAPHAAPSGLPSASSQQEGGWQSYDMEMMAEYTPTQQSLPPYDPFGQPQQHGYVWTSSTIVKPKKWGSNNISFSG